MNSTFKELFKEWTDFDVAMHILSKLLGISDASSSLIEYKKVYWSNNSYSDELGRILDSLIKIEVLLFDQNELKVKYNMNAQVVFQEAMKSI